MARTARMFTIDTLQFSERLVKEGMEPKLAKVLVEEFKEIGEQSIDGLATKQDIKDVKQEIKDAKQELKAEINEVKQEISSVKQELKAEINEVRKELKNDIDLFKQETKQDIQNLEVKIQLSEKKLIIWLGGFTIFTGITVAGFVAWLLNPVIAKILH